MALRFEDYEAFGSLRVPRFRDDADGKPVYIEDEALAQKLGAPASAPAADFLGPQTGAPMPGLAERGALAGNALAPAAPEQRADFGEQGNALSSAFGKQTGSLAPPSPAQTPTQAPATPEQRAAFQQRMAGGITTAPYVPPSDAVDPNDLQRVSMGPQYAPARTVKVSDGGMMPVSEQQRISGPAAMDGWSRESAADRATEVTDASVENARAQYELNNAMVHEQQRADARNANQVMFDRMDKQRELERTEAKTRWEQESIQREINDVLSRKPGEGQYARQQSTANTVLSTIGLMFAGLGGVDSAQAALGTLERARQAEIKAQEDDISRNKDRVASRYNDFQERLKTGRSPKVVKAELDAILQAEQVAELKRPETARVIQQNGIDYNAFVIQAEEKLNQSLANIANLYQSEQVASSQYAPAQYVQVGGAPKRTGKEVFDSVTAQSLGEARNEVEAGKASGQIKTLQDYDTAANHYLQLIENMPAAGWADPGWKARVEAAHTGLQLAVKDKEQMGAWDNGTAALSETFLGKPASDVVALKSTAMEKIKQSLKTNRDKLESTVRSVGLTTMPQLNRSRRVE